jgi:predicted DNA-binding transcriptional regulator AlpA
MSGIASQWCNELSHLTMRFERIGPRRSSATGRPTSRRDLELDNGNWVKGSQLRCKRTFLRDCTMRGYEVERRAAKELAIRRAEILERKRQISERQLVNRRQAAKLLGVTLRTLRRWHEDNQGPPRVSFGGRRVFYAMPEILEHVNAKELRRSRRSRQTATISTGSGLPQSPRE